MTGQILLSISLKRSVSGSKLQPAIDHKLLWSDVKLISFSMCLQA